MKSATLVRHRLGIAQTQMAKLLGVKRSVIALYETGRRSLPVSAILRLVAIEKFLANSAGEQSFSHPILEQQRLKAKTMVDRFAQEQAYRKAVAERTLLLAQEAFNQSMLLLAVLDHLKPTDATTNEEQALLPMKMLEMDALETIGQHGLHKQALLQLEISHYTGTTQPGEILDAL